MVWSFFQTHQNLRDAMTKRRANGQPMNLQEVPVLVHAYGAIYAELELLSA